MSNKKKAPVLVVYTRPEMWEAVERGPEKIAVQAIDKRDADYFAFIFVGQKDKKGNLLPSEISHYAKVKKIRSMKMSDYIKRAPVIRRLCEEKGWCKKMLKGYILDEIMELSKPIIHRKGDSSKGQVCFYTTLEELKSAKFISDIKTLSQLEALRKKVKKVSGAF